MLEQMNPNQLIKDSPKERSSIELPLVLLSFLYGLMDCIEENIGEPITMKEMEAAIIFNGLMQDPASNEQSIILYRKARMNDLAKLGITPGLPRPKFGNRHKPLDNQ